jgi:structural maintenance of chromosome 4
MSQAVRGILEAARQGGELSKVGVIGRLGDLATIGDEYDVAVSTACGMLDNIVVQTTAGVQRCLEFLRKYNLGRAKFIPLDKMKKGAHDRVVETPENAPRLFDLITPKNHAIAPALYLAVGETLVAEDLETATRWAYDFGKRWRVVTKDGKLIEASGTMSGGGGSVRRGGMKLASGRGKNALEEDGIDNSKSLEEEASRAQEFLKECRESRKNLTEEIRCLKKRIKVLEAKLPKIAIEIDGCDTTRTELTKFIPELRSMGTLSKQDTEKLTELKQKVNKCKNDMSACAMLASKLEADVARLQKAIIDAGGSKLKKQQDACEKALEKLNATEKALNQAKVSITSMEKAGVKAEKAKTATEKELEECISKAEIFQNEFKSLEEDAYQVMQAYEKVKVAESAARESLEEASKECDQLKQSLAEVKCVEVELVAKIDDLDKQIVDSERKMKKWETDLKKLRTAAGDDESDSEEEVEDGAGSTAPDDDAGVVMEDNEGNDEREQAESPNHQQTYLPVLSFEALQKYDKDEILSDISVLETERNTIAKHANMGAIAEYRKKEADYLSRVGELDVVTEERNNARKKHEDLRRQRLEMFMDGFGLITLKLKEMYQMITLGGDAELELVDSLDPFSEGIVFSVRPPKKSWKNISNLSGGEKTLSSLALVFALHHFKPTPLYVMDEIDAALDFKNVSIVANYIKERTRNAQFIIISLRNNMFELADRLVGIYKTNNCTKSVSINPRAFGVAATSKNGHVSQTPGALSERKNNTDRIDGAKIQSTLKAIQSTLKAAQRRISLHDSEASTVDA